MSSGTIFLLGSCGAAFDELLHWVALRRRATFPTYARSPFYWIVTVVLITGGGLVTYVLAISINYSIQPIVAFVAGFSAPALVKKLSKTFLGTPKLGAGESSARPSLVSFLSD
jgi:hypothetical protein